MDCYEALGDYITAFSLPTDIRVKSVCPTDGSLVELCDERDKHDAVRAQTIDNVSLIGSAKRRFADGTDP